MSSAIVDSISDHPQRPSRWIDHLLSRPYTVIAVLVLGTMGIMATLKRESAWDFVSVGAAHLLVQGQDFYRHIPLYTYPPFTAFFSLPFIWLPLRIARAIWCVICAISLVYLVVKSWKLSGGPRLQPLARDPAAQWPEHLAFLLGLACALQFALNAFTHLQSDLLIGALLMVGCHAIATRQFFRAATWIGIATAFKATPLLFAPYLLWRRQWIAAIWLVAVAVGANMLPDVIHRPPEGGVWLTRWYHLYLEPMGSSTYLPGDWKNQLDNNQSIAGAANRWLTTKWEALPEKFKVSPRAHHPGPGVVRGFFFATSAALLLLAAWGFWPHRLRDDRSRGDDPRAGSAGIDMLECSCILLLMLLLSPNSSRAHFCIMLLPAFCVARAAVQKPAYLTAALLALAVLCSTLSIHIRIRATYTAEQLLLWLGVVFFSAIFLLLACVLLLRKTRRSSVPT